MTYSKDTLRQIFQQPFNETEWQRMLQHYFHATELKAAPERIEGTEDDEQGYYLGAIDTIDSYRIGLFYYQIRHGNVARKRVGLRNLVKSLVNPNLGDFDAALVVFDSSELWRLSFVCDIKGENTAAKRYTYVFGETDNYYNTPVGRFDALQRNGISFENIKDAFSVERLNKDFFDGYRKQYAKFLATLSDGKKNRDYVKKLLGRIVFLHFLQKKGWMGVPASNPGWEGGDRNYLANLINRYNGNDRLLSDVLEPLFFNTLNEKRENDIADSILGDNIKIPYLNGGLFEKDSIDRLDIDFPYSYFKELMEFFSMYNFTIDENDPEDSEVGIDPEMLGHIFENLLEDNKDKGAFYTPKEIVQYMCRESIIQYLIAHIKDDLFLGHLGEQIKDLINNQHISKEIEDESNAERLYHLLKEVKVCDPAIGSGAFPMGILNVLFHSRRLLHNIAFKNTDFVSTDVKRDIIQNNIFGVDIEQGAVDIARLRFWLALVVDADTPQPLPNLDYKIVCGNSLLNRHALDIPIDDVFAYYNRKNNADFTLADYQQLVAEYTDTSDHALKDKFKEKIADIKGAFKISLNNRMLAKRNRILGQILSLESDTLFGPPTKECLKQAKELRKSHAKLLSLNSDMENDKLYADAFEWRFEFPSLLDENGNFTGFDIVIGNPPYLRIQGIRAVNPAFADELTDKYHSATGAFDLYALFVERGLQIINSTGIVNFIMPVKWTNAAFGKGLRGLLADKVSKIINFGAYQVFNASTYTALQWFMPQCDGFSYYELDRNLTTNQEVGEYLFSLNDDKAAKINRSKLDNKPWTLTVGKNAEIIKLIEQHPRCIGDIFDKIFQGLATSKDDVYFLYDCSEEAEVIQGYSKQLDRSVCIERGLVKPLLKGEDVHRYDNIITDRFVIFPYKLENGKAILYTEEELSKLYPNGYAYLKECEDILRNREKGRFNINGEWFQYGRKQGIMYAEKTKLVAPDISLGGNFAYDENGVFYQTTTIYGYIKKEHISESYKFWMALLNSRLFWWYLTNTGTTLANGFFRFKPDYIKPFPVPEFRQISKGEKIVEKLTDFLLYLYDKNNADILTHTSNKRLATHIEEIIDMIFYELYFEQHMKDNQIDVISDLNRYDWSGMPDATTIESFYKWYQQSNNMVRQKIMLLDTRSKNLIYQIYRTATT